MNSHGSSAVISPCLLTEVLTGQYSQQSVKHVTPKFQRGGTDNEEIVVEYSDHILIDILHMCLRRR
jgi:hypothetical protein